MGSFISSFAPAGYVASIGPSRVEAFHSSSEWKNYFNTTINSFFATWCGPCRMIEPVFAEISNKFTDVSFIKINVDELADVAREYDVKAMPTFVLLKKGKQIDKFVGAKKDELRRKIESHRG